MLKENVRGAGASKRRARDQAGVTARSGGKVAEKCIDSVARAGVTLHFPAKVRRAAWSRASVCALLQWRLHMPSANVVRREHAICTLERRAAAAGSTPRPRRV